MTNNVPEWHPDYIPPSPWDGWEIFPEDHPIAVLINKMRQKDPSTAKTRITITNDGVTVEWSDD